MESPKQGFMRVIDININKFFNDSASLQKKKYWIFSKKLLLPMVFDSLDEMLEKINIKKHIIYLEMAKIWAKNSYCNRKKVGCLIVKDKMIISDGYNGTPYGFENNCEDEEGITKREVLHAESNAITKLASSTISSNGSTVYITLSPCFECAKLIIQAGIKKVIYIEDYHKIDSLKLLIQAGIEVIKITI